MALSLCIVCASGCLAVALPCARVRGWHSNDLPYSVWVNAHSITASARSRADVGTVRPRRLAVLRLTISVQCPGQAIPQAAVAHDVRPETRFRWTVALSRNRPRPAKLDRTFLPSVQPRSSPDGHSITSSARVSNCTGTSRPSAFAVLRLMTSSYFVGACTGRSAGFSPLRMRST